MLILCTPQFSKGSIEAVSPDEANRVLKEIFSKNIEMYHKYRGIETVRNELISEYEPNTNKLRSVSEITVTRTDYFYEKPLVQVKAYKKDGKVMEPSKFIYLTAMPTFPVFDEKGQDNYDIRITEKTIFNGRECYRIQVTPKKKTERHFKGYIYYAVKNLDLVYFEGTVAKLDFSMKSFNIEFNMVMYNGIPVTSSGRASSRVMAPLFYPDTILVTNIKVLKNKLLPL